MDLDRTFLAATILQAPAWIRADLSSNFEAVRERAADALAEIIRTRVARDVENEAT